ncbi:MAG TPA: hypothetical protein VF177_15805 [Anaerolineae bacterium]
MNERKLVLVFVLVALLLAIVAASSVWAKAHVPIDQVQVCHKGRTVKNVDAPALGGHVGHGDFRLPACDFNNVFQPGDDCSDISDENNDGLADAGLNPRADACGVTPACPAGGFEHPVHPAPCF